MSELVLPTKKSPPEIQSPANIIIFSKPKVGKTELAAGLEDCLILDFEKGSKYVECMAIEIDSIDKLTEVGQKIKEANFPYKYIVVDTVTAMEDMCITYAEKLYSQSPMGKNWFNKEDGGKKKYGNILNIPEGAGYNWLRLAFNNAMTFIKKLAPRVIFLGHVKDILINKSGADFTASDLDLTGKIKRITASNCDTIGYLYRKGNQNILSFKSSDEISCGARPKHLRNQEIVISELINQGTPEEKVITHWDKIYID